MNDSDYEEHKGNALLVFVIIISVVLFMALLFAITGG